MSSEIVDELIIDHHDGDGQPDVEILDVDVTVGPPPLPPPLAAAAAATTTGAGKRATRASLLAAEAKPRAGLRGSVSLDNGSLSLMRTLQQAPPVPEARPLPPTQPSPRKPRFVVGQTVWALYHEDSIWYLADIEAIDGLHYDVSYCKYGNKQRCLLEELEFATDEDIAASAPTTTGLACFFLLLLFCAFFFWRLISVLSIPCWFFAHSR
jgi:hypothetical protein